MWIGLDFYWAKLWGRGRPILCLDAKPKIIWLSLRKSFTLWKDIKASLEALYGKLIWKKHMKGLSGIFLKKCFSILISMKTWLNSLWLVLQKVVLPLFGMEKLLMLSNLLEALNKAILFLPASLSYALSICLLSLMRKLMRNIELELNPLQEKMPLVTSYLLTTLSFLLKLRKKVVKSWWKC